MKQFNVVDFLNGDQQKNIYKQANVEEDIISYFKEKPEEWHRPAKDFFIQLCLKRIPERAWFIDICHLNEFLEERIYRALQENGIDIEKSPTFQEVKEIIENNDKDF